MKGCSKLHAGAEEIFPLENELSHTQTAPALQVASGWMEPRSVLYLKLVMTAIFWGGTFVAGRIVAREAGPFTAAFLRFVVASLFLLVFVLKSQKKIPLPEPGQLFVLFLLGLTGVFAYNVFFFSGLRTITAGRASLIIAANPAAIAFLSSLFLKERLGWRRTFGIALSVTGALTVISRGDPFAVFRGGLGHGELYILGCVASWASYSIIGKEAMKKSSPLLSVTYACVLGALCLLFPAIGEGMLKEAGRLSGMVWMGVFYLGFFGSALGFIWYYEGIRVIGASRAGVFINIVPISSILLASIILKESLDASLAAGGVLVLAGVYLTNKA